MDQSSFGGSVPDNGLDPGVQGATSPSRAGQLGMPALGEPHAVSEATADCTAESESRSDGRLEDPGEPRLIADRRAKLRALRERGVDPFPPVFPGVSDIVAVRDRATRSIEDRGPFRIAGRLAARRDFGRTVFLDIEDCSGLLQAYARRDELGDDAFGEVLELDLGDVVGVDGSMFTTRQGELTLRASRITLLTKSLRPPPNRR